MMNKKTKIKNLILILFVAIMILLPVAFVWATSHDQGTSFYNGFSGGAETGSGTSNIYGDSGRVGGSAVSESPPQTTVKSNEYKLLQPLPGLSQKGGVTLSNYLSWLFPFALTVAAFLAVMMIVIGGVVYMSGGSEGAKTKGREMINQAILGLLLAISSYLILYTLNPDLVNMELGIPNIIIKKTVKSGTSGDNAKTYYFEYSTKGVPEESGSFQSLEECQTFFASFVDITDDSVLVNSRIGCRFRININ